MGRDSTQSNLKPTFYDRWGRAILLLTMVIAPVAFYGAAKAVQSNVNKVEDWLPKTFDETKQLGWFRKHFASDQFIIISWEGCKLGSSPDEDDARIERLARLLVPDSPEGMEIAQSAFPPAGASEPLPQVDAELQAGIQKYFKAVTTGRRVLNRLQSPPLSVEANEAAARLKGSLLGPDGNQTCVVVNLNSGATRELKSLLGSGYRRIFRPNVPPGVLHRVITAAGIPAKEVHIGGPPVDNAAIDEEGERTLVRLAGVSGLLGLGLAWWSLRSIMLTLIVFASGVLSAAASLATVWYTGETVDAILMAMPSLVYVLSISGAVHLINYYKEAIQESGLYAAAERAVLHAWKPALLCSTTTALGLVSLTASELVPIRKFGIYSAAGMMTLLGILYLYLPAALHYINIGKKWVEQGKIKPHETQTETVVIGLPEPVNFGERVWRAVSSTIVRNHAIVMTGCMLVILAVGLGLGKTRTSINLLELFDGKAKILQDYAWLEKNLGVLVPMELVIKFDPDKQMAAADVNHATEEDMYKLTFLDRMETISQIQQVITARFGENGAGIVGPSMSAASFSPPLPSASGNTASFVHRKALNMRLESSQQEFAKAGFLKTDPDDGAQLWRISLRVAAFKGVDYGKFVDDIRSVVQPVIQAHVDRDRVLRQLAEWSPEHNFVGSKVVLWDRSPKTENDKSSQPASDVIEPNSKTLASLLVKARCKVVSTDLDPSSIPLTQLETLRNADAILLVGNFTDSDLRTIGGTLPRTILLGDRDGSPSNRGLMTPLSIRDRDVKLDAVYTGVVPIVYKAQRALLDSLIESTLWSFLTITPLMMFVSRSLLAGMVAMIPNVLPVVVIFGAMGWMDIPIDIGSMMTASIALGVAVDDTIHFLSWYRADVDRLQDRNLAIIASYQKCGTPTLQAALISGLGLSVFALSTFTPTQRFGWLMLSILVAGVVSELVMLPALLAGPLGRVFTPSTKRHALPSRLYLIARYQIRRWMAEATSVESGSQTRRRVA